jgi:hypothetical protein
MKLWPRWRILQARDSAEVSGLVDVRLSQRKEPHGRYVGFRSFVVVMNNDRIALSAVSDGGAYDFVAGQCQQAVSKGILPPAEALTAAPAAAPMVLGLATKLGFTYRNDADSIAVKEVSPGGIAASAELSPSMVIERVNGLSLDGLTPEVRAKLLDKAEARSVLAIGGRGEMRWNGRFLNRSPLPRPSRRSAENQQSDCAECADKGGGRGA